MFGIFIFAKLAEWLKKRDQKKHRSEKVDKKLGDIELPGFLSIFNENMVATSILMLFFFGIILLVLGQDYLIQAKFMQEGQSFFFYIMTTSLNFAVYLAILQLGVRTFVDELTQSFQGISKYHFTRCCSWIDVATTFGFGSPNAVTIGFLFGALGQFLMIGLLILLKSPTIVIAGFIPLFFDNAVIAVYANNRGGVKVCLFIPIPFRFNPSRWLSFICYMDWIISIWQDYLGMFDWATTWPLFTIIMKVLGYVGVAVVVIGLLIIPQLQYRKNPEGYFMIVNDYEQYAKKFQEN